MHVARQAQSDSLMLRVTCDLQTVAMIMVRPQAGPSVIESILHTNGSQPTAYASLRSLSCRHAYRADDNSGLLRSKIPSSKNRGT